MAELIRKPKIEMGSPQVREVKGQKKEGPAVAAFVSRAESERGLTSGERQHSEQVAVEPQHNKMDVAGINASGRVKTALEFLKEAYHVVYTLTGNLGNGSTPIVNKFLEALEAKAHVSSSNPPASVAA